MEKRAILGGPRSLFPRSPLGFFPFFPFLVRLTYTSPAWSASRWRKGLRRTDLSLG